MSNKFERMKSRLRSYVKRNKIVKYSVALVVTFLMGGGLLGAAESETINHNTVAQFNKKIKDSRINNRKKLRVSELELIQLEEQGDQVVKSPWSSWQFGAEYTYKDTNKVVKGTGDKAEIYKDRSLTGGKYNLPKQDGKDMWWLTKVSPNSEKYAETLGGLIQNGYYDPTSSLTYDRQDSEYGLVPVNNKSDPKVDITVFVNIPQKNIVVDPVTVTPAQPPVIDLPTTNIIVVDPITVNIPDLTVPAFTKVTVKVEEPSIVNVSVPVFTVPDTGNANESYVMEKDAASVGNGHSIFWNDSGNISNNKNVLISQVSLVNGTLDVETDGNFTDPLRKVKINVEDSISLVGGRSPDVSWGSLSSTWDTPTTNYILKIIGAVKSEFTGMTVTYTGVAGGDPSNTLKKPLLFTDAHNTGGGDSIWKINGDSTFTLKGQNVLLYSVQSHGTAGNSGLVNMGTITADNLITNSSGRIIMNTVEDDRTYGEDRYFYLDNKTGGMINLNGTDDLLVNHRAGQNLRIVNNGKIVLAGKGAKGINIGGVVRGLVSNSFGDSEIILNNAIEMTGDETVGLIFTGNRSIGSTIDLSTSLLNFNIGHTQDIFDTSGAIDASFVKGAVGIYTNDSTFTLNAGTDTNVSFGVHAYGSMMYRSDGMGNITVKGITNLDNGQFNLAMVSTGGTMTLDNTGVINVTGGTLLSNNTAAYVTNGGTITNNGLFEISGGATNGVIISEKSGTQGAFLNVGSIKKTNDGAAIVMEGGKLTSAGLISTSGGSAGIYSSKTVDTSNITILGDTTTNTGLIAGNGGIAYYSDVNGTSTGNIAINSNNITNSVLIKTGGLMFYNKYEVPARGGAIPTLYGKFTVHNSTIELEDGATLFKFDSVDHTYETIDYQNYLTKSFDRAPGETLTVNLPLNGFANIFVVSETTTSLSSLDALDIGTYAPWLSLSDEHYRLLLLADGILNIDPSASGGTSITPYNLDNLADIVNKVDAVNSIINILPNTYIKGTEDRQVFIKQENKLGQATSDILMTNEGNISMAGKESVVFFSKHGDITNKGYIGVSNGAFGILGQDGAPILNDTMGVIEVGTKNSDGISNSIGIAGATRGATVSVFGDETVHITNDGTIVGTAGAVQPIGIYANNYLNLNKSDVDVKNNGTVDMTGTSGVNVYMDKHGTFTNTGTISVGDNTVGILSQGSDIIINGGTLNLLGTNSVLFALNDDSNFTGNTGTINVAGSGNVLFNLKSFTGAATDNLTINVAAGTQYTYANLDDSDILFNGSLTVGSNSTLFNGQNGSSIEFGTSANIVATGNTNAAMVVDGNGYAGYEGINHGNITLLNSSVGLHAKNGAELQNTGTISVIDSSAGIYNEGGATENAGTIEVGSLSSGIYQKEGTLNLNAGSQIKSNGMKSTGVVYEHSVGGIIENFGTISMLGDESIGIYLDGLGTNTMINTGTINVGQSVDKTKPNIAMYSGKSNHTITNNGVITAGNNSLGIYGLDSINLTGISSLVSGDNSIGVYSNDGTVHIQGGATLSVGAKSTGVYSLNGNVINDSSNIGLSNDSFGFVLTGTNTNFTGNATNISATGNDMVYVYSASDAGSTVVNHTNINLNGDGNIGIYAKSGETIVNSGSIDLSNGNEGMGIYTNAGKINNSGHIIISGSTDPNQSAVGIAGVGKAEVYNNGGIIEVTGSNAVGLYGSSAKDNAGNIIPGTRPYVENNGTIYLNPSATATTNQIGMYLDGADGVNKGYIGTGANTLAHNQAMGVDRIMGIVAVNGSTFVNSPGATIEVNADSSIGIYVTDSVIKNYGQIIVSGDGSKGVAYLEGVSKGNAADPNGTIITQGKEEEYINGGQGTVTASNGADQYSEMEKDDTSKELGNVAIKDPAGGNDLQILVDGKPVPTEGHYILQGEENNIAFHNVGIYIDTLGRTNLIDFGSGSMSLTGSKNSLIIGSEITEITNSKYLSLQQDILDKLNKQLGSMNGTQFEVTSGSLTWMATPVWNDPTKNDFIKEVLMAKIHYSTFTDDENAKNFTEGLEQRYGVDERGVRAREKELFDKLNGIGANQKVLLSQAYDEMFGHPYANVQQRILSSGRLIDKNVDDLFKWETVSKQSNKVKAIGGVSEYKTDTAGVVDYKQKSLGVVYLNEHETVKLGNSNGWYGGLLYDKFDFDDIEESREEVITAKIGIYNSTAFDHNNSLNWTVKGDISAGYHKMHRKYLVVDEQFSARGNYYSYGVNVKNEISKDFRLSKNIKAGPIASLELGYGRFTKIEEDKGEIRLEVKGNNYYTIKPAVGARISYSRPIGASSLKFKAELEGKVEQELGKTTDIENKARVANTTANYYNLKKDKGEKTNANVGLNLELGNDRLAFTVNGEYNTQGENAQVGVGLRIVF